MDLFNFFSKSNVDPRKEGKVELSRVENMTEFLNSATERTPIPALTLHNLPSQAKRTIIFCFLVERIKDLIVEMERFSFFLLSLNI